MPRSDFEFADRYAFYLAYDQVCGYCGKHLAFLDLQIDHIVPQRLAEDPLEWQTVLATYGLPPTFQVDSDENRMSSCGQDNCRKSDDVLPRGQAILLLNSAAKRVSRVKEIRTEVMSARQQGRTLAQVQKAWNQSDSFREDLLAIIGTDFPTYKGVAPRAWNDPNESSRVKRLLGTASEALLSWPQDIGGHWIERPELLQVETTLTGDRPPILALLGPPGSGKSALLARLGSTLRDQGCILLAIKADLLPSNVESLSELDRWLHVSDSLPILIERLAAEASVTILVDQLDALSELMDTRTERLSALLSLSDRVARIPGVSVVISCRSFDAAHDLRLRSLVEREKTITIELADPQWDIVSKVLAEQGFNSAPWPDCVRQVLRRPQHLKLFIKHFKALPDRPTFENYQTMLETILQERVLRPFGSRAVAALEVMSHEMATREELWIPRAGIEQRFRNEVIQLQEAGLVNVSTDQTRVGFGHQTVFDFLRARSLVTSTRNLFSDVKSRQD